MSGHIHAELMAQYAEDARETIWPWERWECRRDNKEWQEMWTTPSWYISWQYRRKPRTITINGREVPEPMRSAPEEGQFYFMPSTIASDFFCEEEWHGSRRDMRWLSCGLCHSTKEAAIAHAEALLSFTEVK